MEITDMDRLNAVQHKLFEVKTWVDETLRILNYVCIDEDHKAFKAASKATTYPGQLADITFEADDIEDTIDEIEQCSS